MSTDRKRRVSIQSWSRRADMTVTSGCGGRALQGGVDGRLRILQQLLQVTVVAEAFGVDLVDVLGPRRARREPATGGDHLDATDGGPVAGRLVEHLLDRLAGQFSAPDPVRRERGKRLLLCGIGGRLDTVGKR